ncbi:hypothetical protein [Nocardioides sp. 503]|nr:hypothetical protein [Nocardioides sp. 503]
MRTETEHELDPLLPHLSEILMGVLSLGLLVAFLVVLAVVLRHVMRH